MSCAPKTLTQSRRRRPPPPHSVEDDDFQVSGPTPHPLKNTKKSKSQPSIPSDFPKPQSKNPNFTTCRVGTDPDSLNASFSKEAGERDVLQSRAPVGYYSRELMADIGFGTRVSNEIEKICNYSNGRENMDPNSLNPSFSKESEERDVFKSRVPVEYSMESTADIEFCTRVSNEIEKSCNFSNGRENVDPKAEVRETSGLGFPVEMDGRCCLDSIESNISINIGTRGSSELEKICEYPSFLKECKGREGLQLAIPVDMEGGCCLDSIKSASCIEIGNRASNEIEKSCNFPNVRENVDPNSLNPSFSKYAEDKERLQLGIHKKLDGGCCLDSIESAIDIEFGTKVLNERERSCYLATSLESRLLNSIAPLGGFDGNGGGDNELGSDGNGSCSDLDVLLKLCDDGGNERDGDWHGHVCCPLCGADISNLPNELREEHTNNCLDKEENLDVLCANDNVPLPGPGQVVDVSPSKSPMQAADVSPVIEWLRSQNLAKYEEIFAQEEIDWDTLQWLTEEDLLAIGITALGPRKKIVQALGELRKGSSKKTETRIKASSDVTEDTNRVPVNKLITDFFPGCTTHKKTEVLSKGGHEVDKSHSRSVCPEHKKAAGRKTKDRKLRDIPQWCCIPGTPIRVDAFKYLRSDCSHWFLTHFHLDHYQGLTRSFSHGKIYCSLVTAKLVNMKIGIPWDKLQVLPLNKKINVAGIDVTCFDANHCPGAIIVLFELPGGKAVLHTGDFRFTEKMTNIPVLQTCRVQTLVLDTTYCNPQFDFPKQEAVIQFVIEAIQAEAFNKHTLFLIGSYTIGKERLFLEVARVLRKKVYVAAAKLRILECLGLPMEDMQWFTSNEHESHIHVVPMWSLASFKRLKCISNQYAHRYSLIVAFSPTGWSFGKGKKKSTGRRWQQGTIVRYEVPYSEHSSYTELKEFVKFISPENIVPSVNNHGLESANAMVSLLLS